MIGIRFEIPNEWNSYLSLIFKDVNDKTFNWIISDEEIYLADYSDLFKESIYKNDTFKEVISNDKYYLISGNILAFKSLNYKDISTYEDFLNSDCEILMVVVDSYYVDVYVKNDKILEQIRNNAIDNKFKNIEYIIKDSNRNIFHTY
ncbi:MAG: DUF2691 family protein [Bacilli bacterium]|jgi:hypothetical protein|nr:DUF2691 family protein [Bacilli bacterium]